MTFCEKCPISMISKNPERNHEPISPDQKEHEQMRKERRYAIMSSEAQFQGRPDGRASGTLCPGRQNPATEQYSLYCIGQRGAKIRAKGRQKPET